MIEDLNHRLRTLQHVNDQQHETIDHLEHDLAAAHHLIAQLRHANHHYTQETPDDDRR